MIDAREILKSIKLPAPDEAEVQRLGAEIVSAVRKPEYDGRPFNIQIPVGESEEQHARTYRIACALQRRFQAKGWVSQLDTQQDAFGNPQVYSLWFAIDPAAMRETASVAIQTEAKFSLRGLYEELGTIFGAAAVPALPAKPVLSILLGTYNRLPLLREAIASVRKSVGSLAYEVIVVDGGSVDGSRAWLAAQPDVLLVGERRLEGAVAAFNQAFTLCRGEFVANANDDVRYEGLALAEGVRHLQEHPEVGQVAFALRGEGEDFAVHEIHSSLAYANHGVVRKSLADKISYIQGGFWAPIYHTYAADCEFSAWCHRLSRVDARSDLRVHDARPDDALRERNWVRYGSDTKKMYARWPAAAFKAGGPEPRVSKAELCRYYDVVNGVWWTGKSGASKVADTDALTTFAELVGFPEPGEERRLRKLAPLLRALDPVEGQFPKRAEKIGSERVLHVHINGEKAVDQQEGLIRALKEFGSYEMVRWTDFDREARQQRILDAAKRLSPTLVFMQIQTKDAIDVETIRSIREIAPEAIIATWCGDIASENAPWNVEWQVQVGRLVDLTMHSSMTHVRALRAAGVHNAAYLQIGYDELQYRTPTQCEFVENEYRAAGVGVSDDTEHAHRFVEGGGAFDVCFLGSKYGSGDAFSKTYNWESGVPAHDSALRDEVVAKMREAFGERFGLFGSGWNEYRACVRCGKLEKEMCLDSNECQDREGVWGLHVVGKPYVETVPVTESHEVYWKSRIGLSVSLDNKLECYTSDRLLRIMACGSLLLVKRFPGMDVLGLEHEVNCAIWDTSEEAVEFAKRLAGGDEFAQGIAAAGAKMARENHTWGVRMRELQPYIDAVRAAR